MNCEKARERLNAFLDHETTEADTLEIRGHLSGCPACQTELRELQRLNAYLAGYRLEEAADGLMGRIIGGTHIRPLSWRSRMAVAACAAVILFGGFALGKAYNASNTTTATSPMAFGQESLYTYFGGSGR
jgi:anti-sigma factor RsiW